jgi:hypothetical protein
MIGGVKPGPRSTTPHSRRAAAPSPYPSTDDIAARAHALFVRGGRILTLLPEYWRIAEAELLDAAAQRLLGPQRPPPPRR